MDDEIVLKFIQAIQKLSGRNYDETNKFEELNFILDTPETDDDRRALNLSGKTILEISFAFSLPSTEKLLSTNRLTSKEKMFNFRDLRFMTLKYITEETYNKSTHCAQSKNFEHLIRLVFKNRKWMSSLLDARNDKTEYNNERYFPYLQLMMKSTTTSSRDKVANKSKVVKS
jgi:hypothetical protein